MTVLTLISRSGCHLCDTARAELEAIDWRQGVVLDERDVDADAELQAEYGDSVPVLLIDGVVHSYFGVDADRLVAALGDASS